MLALLLRAPRGMKAFARTLLPSSRPQPLWWADVFPTKAQTHAKGPVPPAAVYVEGLTFMIILLIL